MTLGSCDTPNTYVSYFAHCNHFFSDFWSNYTWSIYIHFQVVEIILPTHYIFCQWNHEVHQTNFTKIKKTHSRICSTAKRVLDGDTTVLLAFHICMTISQIHAIAGYMNCEYICFSSLRNRGNQIAEPSLPLVHYFEIQNFVRTDTGAFRVKNI